MVLIISSIGGASGVGFPKVDAIGAVSVMCSSCLEINPLKRVQIREEPPCTYVEEYKQANER